MDQKKIGGFLSELRKEQGMTQQQLADAIGVSSKTVSKWECGKGMPEMSSVLPLCEFLHISVNELLSGERLPVESYPKKAEENIICLMQDNEDTRKNQQASPWGILAAAAASLCVIVFITYINVGPGGLDAFFQLANDASALLCMLFLTALFLLVTRLGRPFLNSFALAVGKKEPSSAQALLLAKAAVRLAQDTFLVTGLLISCLNLATFAADFLSSPSNDIRVIGVCVPLILSAALYGLAGFLLLLPIRLRLEAQFALADKIN